MSDKWEKKRSKKHGEKRGEKRDEKRDEKHRSHRDAKEDEEVTQQGSDRYVDDISNFLYTFKHREEDDEDLPPPSWTNRKVVEKAPAQATNKSPPRTHDRRDRVVKALPMSDAHRQTPSKRANPMPLEPPSSHHLEATNK